MQLHDWLNSRRHPGSRLCTECKDLLDHTEDRQIECMVPGCNDTWTYVALDQLKDKRLGKSAPANRRCETCEQFLSSNDRQTIACENCGAEIQWSAYEQLLCKLGTFVKPTLCSDCAGRQLALAQPEPAPKADHHHIVRVPSSGRWHADERIRQWPPHLDHDAIAAAEKADIRIVAFGDDLTFSSTNPADAWPALLQQALRGDHPDDPSLVVINAGIPRCTSRQGLARLPRDVEPFAPCLVIVSFTFADALLELDPHAQNWRPNLVEQTPGESLGRIFQRMRARDTGVLYWTPNPIFPEDALPPDADGRLQQWAKEQTAAIDHTVRSARHQCSKHGINEFNVQSRFEVNGARSARKWMSDWHSHNSTGAVNIARWFAEEIRANDLIPALQPAAAEGEQVNSPSS